MSLQLNGEKEIKIIEFWNRHMGNNNKSRGNRLREVNKRDSCKSAGGRPKTSEKKINTDTILN